jgi:hypothetical protein
VDETSGAQSTAQPDANPAAGRQFPNAANQTAGNTGPEQTMLPKLNVPAPANQKSDSPAGGPAGAVKGVANQINAAPDSAKAQSVEKTVASETVRPRAGELSQIGFSDRNNGYGVNTNGLWHKTHDGGLTWVPDPYDYHIYAFAVSRNRPSGIEVIDVAKLDRLFPADFLKKNGYEGMRVAYLDYPLYVLAQNTFFEVGTDPHTLGILRAYDLALCGMLH